VRLAAATSAAAKASPTTPSAAKASPAEAAASITTPRRHAPLGCERWPRGRELRCRRAGDLSVRNLSLVPELPGLGILREICRKRLAGGRARCGPLGRRTLLCDRALRYRGTLLLSRALRRCRSLLSRGPLRLRTLSRTLAPAAALGAVPPRLLATCEPLANRGARRACGAGTGKPSQGLASATLLHPLAALRREALAPFAALQKLARRRRRGGGDGAQRNPARPGSRAGARAIARRRSADAARAVPIRHVGSARPNSPHSNDHSRD
jgi:hypothetical protein